VKAKKAIVIGADGLMAEMVEKFAADGTMPNMARLMERGSFTKALPCAPVDSPTNWTSISTGAWTGTHGNNAFAVHYPGEPFEKFHDSRQSIFPSLTGLFCPPNGAEPLASMCEAEFLWDALAGKGGRAILVNWPGGFPVKSEGVISVVGSGPYSSPLSRIFRAANFASAGARKNDRDIPIEFQRATGWRGLARPDKAASGKRALEAAVAVTGEGRVTFNAGEWELGARGAGSPPDPSALLYLLLLAEGGKRYDTLLFCTERDVGSEIGRVRVGEWSDWVNVKLRLKRIAHSGRFLWTNPYEVSLDVECLFRCHLTEVSEDGRSVRLFRTSMFNVTGWTHPPEVARGLVQHLFELGGESGAVHDVLGTDGGTGEIHPPTPTCEVHESAQDQAAGIALVANYLAREHDWDLLMAHIHAPDGAQTRLMNAISPGSPTYVEVDEEDAWDWLAVEYQSIDTMIGQIVNQCADEDTLIAVVSSHASLPTNKAVWLPSFFQQAGLTTYRLDESRQEHRVVWSETRAFVGNFPLGQNVWVNLKGRDPEGIVNAGDEYEKVRAEAAAVLRSVTDPETGQPVLAAVLMKEDAGILGLWGDRVGDLVFFYRPGYVDSLVAFGGGPIRVADFPRDPIMPITEKEGTKGCHHAHLPTAEMGGFSVCGVMLVAGPGIRRGFRRPTPLQMVDVAPTIAFCAGLPIPGHADGNAAANMLA